MDYFDCPLGKSVSLKSDSGTLTKAYEALLIQAMYTRAQSRLCANSLNTPDSEFIKSKIGKFVNHMIEWLKSTDFFTAPASTIYHDSRPSGLLYHSLNVYNQMIELIKLPQFKGKVDLASATMVALVHDWCKIGRYETYYRNVKNAEGVWEQVASYKTAESNMGRLGHGVQSMTMLMQLCVHPAMTLTFEEMAAIRWHMGVYQVTDPERNDLFRCNDMVPMVLLIQFADQLAITNYAND